MQKHSPHRRTGVHQQHTDYRRADFAEQPRRRLRRRRGGRARDRVPHDEPAGSPAHRAGAGRTAADCVQLRGRKPQTSDRHDEADRAVRHRPRAAAGGTPVRARRSGRLRFSGQGGGRPAGRALPAGQRVLRSVPREPVSADERLSGDGKSAALLNSFDLPTGRYLPPAAFARRYLLRTQRHRLGTAGRRHPQHVYRGADVPAAVPGRKSMAGTGGAALRMAGPSDPSGQDSPS